MPFDGSSNPNLQILDEVLALLATPEQWCKGTAARNGRNVSVVFDSDDAVQFCVYGALARVVGKPLRIHDHPVWLAMIAEANLRVEAVERNHAAAINFNNAPETTHADLLDFFERVRARLS